MTQSRAVRGLLAAIVASSTLLASATANADDREQCATAADQAQQLRDDGKYRRAREQLLICARDVCPAPIKRDCLDWLTQLDNIAPTVVLGARDGTKDLVDVKVYVDGVLVLEKLDGRPIPMDLGAHILKFEYQGQTREEQVVIGAGQKSRNIGTTFAAAAPAGPVTPPPGPETPGPRTEGSLVPAFIVGGIGVLALGSFAIFGISGKGEVSDLEKTCKPRCKEEDVDSARSKLIIADISLGIGLVAIGVATYMILTRPKVDGGAVTTGKTGLSSLRFDAGPVRGGAAGSIGASF